MLLGNKNIKTRGGGVILYEKSYEDAAKANLLTIKLPQYHLSDFDVLIYKVVVNNLSANKSEYYNPLELRFVPNNKRPIKTETYNLHAHVIRWSIEEGNIKLSMYKQQLHYSGALADSSRRMSIMGFAARDLILNQDGTYTINNIDTDNFRIIKVTGYLN